MKYRVKELEITDYSDKTLSEMGIHKELISAYLWSKMAGNEVPNFGDNIWETGVEEIEKIVADCKRLGINEITISSTGKDLISKIAMFEKLGAKLDGLVEVKHWESRKKFIPALKMSI